MNRFFTFRPATWLTAVLLLTTLNTVAQQSKMRPAGAAGGHTAPPPPTSVPTPAPASVPVVAAPAAPPEQDIIFDLKGNELAGQVLEVTPTQVVYRPAGSDVALPPTILDKSTLFMVRYANGSRETFAAATATPAPASVSPASPSDGLVGVIGQPMTSDELYRRGAADALRYHSYKGVFWGTFAGTWIGYGVGGLVVGGVCAATRPVAARNPLLSADLLRQPAYVKGYETQAQRRKLGKAAEGFGVAIGSSVVISVIIIAALLSTL